jgi:hypothetical protein
MKLDNLKERTTFIYGDLDLPTPGKLCLIKFTNKYLTRLNRKFETSYIVASLKLINKKPYICFETVKNSYSYSNKEITCSWTDNIVESWYYLEDIEKKLNEIKHS